MSPSLLSQLPSSRTRIGLRACATPHLPPVPCGLLWSWDLISSPLLARASSALLLEEWEADRSSLHLDLFTSRPVASAARRGISAWPNQRGFSPPPSAAPGRLYSFFFGHSGTCQSTRLAQMVKMRVPIREQLGCLVLLASLIGLTVIAIATWVNFILLRA